MYSPQPSRFTMANGHRPPFQPHFQRNPNFVQRGRGPQYGCPQFRKPPPISGQNFNENHWCETCDRGFPSLDILEKHKQQHQKCNIDGCQFIAHPKVITKHIQMQHSSGLFKKIANINNPEDIQRWRDERKRKYPTKENVEKKAAEIKEKMERGEKMGLKYDRNNKYKKPGEVQKRKYPLRNDNLDKRQKMFSNQNRPINNNKKFPSKEKILPISEDNRKLKPFTGIQNLLMEENTEEVNEEEECNFEIELDDDDSLQDNEINRISKAVEPLVCGALSSLMDDYGTSDEETDITTRDCSVNITNKLETNKTIAVLSKVVNDDDNIANNSKPEEFKVEKIIENIKKASDDDSEPEEVKIEKKIEENQTDNQQDVQNMQKPYRKKMKTKSEIHRKIIPKRPKQKLPSTLLHKLLAREIQQERNIVLQCIRYVIKNNYFDK